MGRKKAARDKVKNPVLKKGYTSRVRSEYIDYDYVDDLTEEEKKWLNDFTEEYYSASVGKQSEAEKNQFHKTPELVKERTDANNARNRCLYGRIRNRVGATKLLNYDNVLNMIEDHLAQGMREDEVENALVEFLDNKAVNTTGDTDE